MPSDSKAIVPTIQKARDAGLMVIVLDTPLDPMDAADATFATDNRKAGELIGAVGQGHARRQAAATPAIAFLDLATNQPTVDYLRDQGFMEGFGIDVKDPNKLRRRGRCAHLQRMKCSQGDQERAARRWRTLLQKCPDVNVVYTINEPAAAGAWEALKAVGKDDGCVLIVSVDGGCPGVKNVEAGVIGATSQQYPLQDGLDGARGDRHAARLPEIDPSLGFLDTGAPLITDKPVDGVPIDHHRRKAWSSAGADAAAADSCPASA